MTMEAKDFKAAMSRFLSGVTVVSTQHEGEIWGMTASAFLSVSIDPFLVLVSVGKTAKFHDRAIASGRYGVSILTAEQQDLSGHFAGWPKPGVEPVWEQPDFHSPVLVGALAQVDCLLHQVVDAGDHSLFLGNVQAVRLGEGAPLGYFRGAYVRVS
ncbi:MAG TPA: flavin reductase family protein [Myxococcota bacterium]|nr:flavin reductase family protein [Myxococcota bacterium]HNH49596.1 flavin reductase family protein [Myxococcota bacterium]